MGITGASVTLKTRVSASYQISDPKKYGSGNDPFKKDDLGLGFWVQRVKHQDGAGLKMLPYS